MKRPCLAAMAFLVSSQCVATERGEELVVRSKALAARASAETPAAHSNAPFRASYDPIPGLLQREDSLVRKPQGACEAHSGDLCYDLADRRIVYRPVRQYMPKVEGLTAESVSLRHSRLTLKYSFR
jgi:hypothetical protein